MSFNRGDVVHHKIMGKGIVLGEVSDNGEKLVKVRMTNGNIEKFYPEELETDEVVKGRARAQIEEVNRMNEENAKKFGGFY